jgi:hypothetical protein
MKELKFPPEFSTKARNTGEDETLILFVISLSLLSPLSLSLSH